MPSASKLFCTAKVWAEAWPLVAAGLPEGQPARPQAGAEGRTRPDVWVFSLPRHTNHWLLAFGLGPLEQELPF